MTGYASNWYACSQCGVHVVEVNANDREYLVRGICENCGMVPVVVDWEGKGRDGMATD